MSGTHLWFSGCQGMWQLHFSGSTICNTYSLSSRLRPDINRTCPCPWWSSHSTETSNKMRSSLLLRLDLQGWLPSFFQVEAEPAMECQISVLFWDTCILQDQYHLGKFYTLLFTSCYQFAVQPWSSLDHSFHEVNPRKYFPANVM